MKSDNVKKGPERAPNRSLFYALGYTPEELERPLIGVVSAYSEIVPGHMNLDKLADAVKAGIIGKETLPGLVAMRLGTEPSQILDILVHNIVECSQGGQDIVWDSYYDEAVEEFRNFMFAYVYEGPVLEKEHRKAEHVVLSILDLYMKTPCLLPDKVQLSFERFGKEQAIIDYVSGLTDLSALATFQEYFIPKVN